MFKYFVYLVTQTCKFKILIVNCLNLSNKCMFVVSTVSRLQQCTQNREKEVKWESNKGEVLDLLGEGDPGLSNMRE